MLDEFNINVPLPPLVPAENCKPDVPLINPLIVTSPPLDEPIMVVTPELLVMFPLIITPLAFAATYPASAESPVPPNETIFVGRPIAELLDKSILEAMGVHFLQFVYLLMQIRFLKQIQFLFFHLQELRCSHWDLNSMLRYLQVRLSQ